MKRRGFSSLGIQRDFFLPKEAVAVAPEDDWVTHFMSSSAIVVVVFYIHHWQTDQYPHFSLFRFAGEEEAVSFGLSRRPRLVSSLSEW